ncbi:MULTISPECIES: hypothetical protein [unclassified Curtobacterium]|uniref:hypothetical protein n=1 Tax=unclassified Curtobacterium TaxID=257496 RepID=UPI000F486A23|nr:MULTISPECIES: hypothetical protein [unclassified Curtobacterium]ROQ04775.1 hypothetical protein EDF41_3427 [Curtobacterium sp. PhB171]ROQ28275.1 hypothetical protein EDF40_1409 [Curtobacterium sp. PhB170]ROS33192.1 hypothetical protein EDF25_3251 [Curtobacterium sp. PhB131]ROS72428.1 hypothetical protein EDF30_0354 [Curtobacterium sp. PhB141]
MSPFDADGLWMKSRLFINRAMDPDRDFEERAFWACASLEVLGKSALAHVSPLLVATPTDDGKSLLVASGVDFPNANATSVQAKAVWARCAKLFKPFSDAAATRLSYGRNEYIHSATIGFDAIPEHAWWPSFWAQAVILLQHVQRDVAAFVGDDAAAAVAQHLATNKDTLARQLQARLERARSMLARHTKGTLTSQGAAEWLTFTAPYASYTQVTTCPACESKTALMGGDEKNGTRVDSYQDERSGAVLVDVTVEVNTDFIACPVCHLLINEWDLLAEADVELAFDAEGSMDDLDFEDYNNE